MSSFINTLSQSPVSYGILALTLYTSYLYFKLPSSKQTELVLVPYRVWRGYDLKTLMTSLMIHADWQHFLFNMISFYFFAPFLEQRLQGVHLIGLYIFSGILGNAVLLYRHHPKVHYSALGASGAVSGIVFGFIALYPMLPLQFILIPIQLPAFVFGIIYLFGSFYMAKRGMDHVAHDAHIGGAIGGILYMVMFIL